MMHSLCEFSLAIRLVCRVKYLNACCCALYATKEPILTPGFSPLWQILMSASPLRVPWAPPVWMRSMDIAAYAHQTGLDPTAKKVTAST